MGVPSLNGEWSIQPEEQKAGEKIANNYKRQVAERMTREHLESEGFDIKTITSGGMSKRGKSRGGNGPMSASAYS